MGGGARGTAGIKVAGIDEAFRRRRGKPPRGTLEETMFGMIPLGFLDIFWWLRR